MNSKKIYFFVTGAILTFLFIPQTLFAATLRFSPSSGTYNVGQTFTVSVLVNSSDQAMNAVSGTLSFPSEYLSVSSISKGGSVISLWVKEPSFSNSAGTLNFEGVVLNPGYIGSAGTIVTVTFRAKAQGTAQVTFDNAQVLANDGSGQNILSQESDGTYVLTPEVQVKSVPTEVSKPKPIAQNSLIIKELPRQKTSPAVRFSFVVTDKTFKPEYFRVSINGSDAKQMPLTIDSIYALSGVSLGKNSITVRAVSGTEAFLEAKAEFYLESLIPPVITDYQKIINGEEPLSIKGTSQYPNAMAHITLRRNSEIVVTGQVKTDTQGAFAYINAHELVQGEYVVTAYIVQDDDTQSSEGEAVTIIVQNPFIIYLGTFAINVLLALVASVLLLGLLTLLIIYSYFRIIVFRKKLRKEVSKAEVTLKKSVKLLKEDVTELVSSKDVAKELKKDIDNVEKYVSEEIRDIESLQ